jgi:hypothetical protein
MAIDIFNIEPTVISRDLKGKYLLLYGKPKCGKTSFSAQMPRNLLIAFEKGYNAISGIRPVDIAKWSDFKLVLRQLEKPEARQMYDSVTIDTLTIAWQLCEEFVCAQNGVQKIGDIPWGGGYAACKKEFESALRKITMLGYGLLMITHVSKRVEVDKEGSEIEILSPDMPKRAAEIANGLVDIIGYIGVEFHDGIGERYLYTRETPTIFAGSRFRHLAPKIKFGYNELVEAIADAIEKSESLDGAVVVDHQTHKVEEKLDYNAIKAEAVALWQQLVGSGENANEEMARRILKRAEMIFGRPIKLSEITEDQVDLYNLVVMDMRELASEN